MKITFSLLILISTINAYSQETQSITYSERITNVYYKTTGKKINNKTLQSILKQYPGIALEKVFNKYGQIEKYLYDPDSIVIGVQATRKKENQTKPGQKFPVFSFKTIDQKIIDSEELKGSWVLIRFELFVKMSKLDEIQNLNDQIEDLKSDQKIVPILCFIDSEKSIKKEINTDILNFEIVGDNRNFQEMFSIITFPTTILLDPDGVVVDYFNHGDELILNEILNK